MATVPASEKIRIRSALRLFLSLDVVGSTEFKQPRTDKEPANDDSWVRPFLTFYRMSVDQMAAQWQRVTTEMKAAERGDTGRFVFGECPEFWKGAGDEVLFSKRVVSPLDAIAALHSLVGVMNNVEIVIATDSASAREGHADELTHNYRLLSLLDADPSRRAAYKADYIGPSIDLGFRLRDYSTARRLAVSADLVWLLCHAHNRSSQVERTACPMLDLPRIGYMGRFPLKGILGGDPYPIFWIEAEAGTALDDAEDKLLQRLPHSEGKDVAAYCAKFLDGSGPLRMVPYIPDCMDSDVGTISKERLEKVERLERYVNGEAEQLASLSAADSTSNSTTIPPEAESFADALTKKP